MPASDRATLLGMLWMIGAVVFAVSKVSPMKTLRITVKTVARHRANGRAHFQRHGRTARQA
jgi:hypothetical protein